MYNRIMMLSLLGIAAMGGLPAAAGEATQRRAEPVDRIEKVFPVSAYGVVKAHELIAIKSKSAGRIQDVCVEEGQMVRKGAALVKLESCDEHRTVLRLQAELDRVSAIYQQSLIRLCE